MTQWIRWWGLGVFVAIVLFWWLCIDWIVKAAIESVGTQAMGAKVELEAAELHLVPTSLTLTGLQITDPEALMSNLIVASKVEANLNTLQLFGRKVIAEEMTVSGLQFNTPRVTSGAIKSSPAPDTEWFDADELSFGGAIPGLSLPNVNEIVAQEKAKIKKNYDDINKDLKNLEQKWKQRLAQLPDKEKIEDYEKRIKKLKKGNFLEKLAGLKSIKKDIDKDRNQLKGLDDELENDLKKVESEIKRATQLPEQHINRVLADMGMGENAVDGIATGIMSGQIKQWLQQALSYIKPSDAKSPEAEEVESGYVRGEGFWVHFTQEQTVPEVLIRHALLDGEVSLSEQTIHFKGEANDLTHQPDQWHKPATFNISGRSDQKASIVVNATLDHRANHSKDLVDFQITDLPLSNHALSSSPELTVLAEQALANIKGTMSLIEQDIDLTIDSKFSEVDLQVSSEKSSTMTSVMIDTLQSVKGFDLGLTLKGPAQSPKVDVQSDLNGLLSKAVGESIKKEGQALKAKLTKQLKEQLAPELQQLTQHGGALSTIDEQLGLKQSELKKLTKKL
jgi:uncharacterized protein (TIGR03545 family)